jgi:hypothetical protein
LPGRAPLLCRRRIDSRACNHNTASASPAELILAIEAVKQRLSVALLEIIMGLVDDVVASGIIPSKMPQGENMMQGRSKKTEPSSLKRSI